MSAAWNQQMSSNFLFFSFIDSFWCELSWWNRLAANRHPARNNKRRVRSSGVLSLFIWLGEPQLVEWGTMGFDYQFPIGGRRYIRRWRQQLLANWEGGRARYESRDWGQPSQLKVFNLNDYCYCCCCIMLVYLTRADAEMNACRNIKRKPEIKCAGGNKSRREGRGEEGRGGGNWRAWAGVGRRRIQGWSHWGYKMRVRSLKVK